MKITEARSWEEVERATDIAATCIAPLGQRTWIGTNHQRAKETWEKHQGEVRYFLFGQDGCDGYIRIIRVNESEYYYPTWIADYLKPPDYNLVLQVAPLVQGTLLIKSFTAESKDLGSDWPRFTAGFPKLKGLPYSAQGADEAIWLVVPGTTPYKPTTTYYSDLE